MTNEQNQVRDWMQAFGQECPERPMIPSLEIRKLRAKLDLEETFERVKALGFDIDDGSLVDDMMAIATIVEPNLIEIADGCEDGKVVIEGTLVACGLVDNRLIYRDSLGGPIDNRPIHKRCGIDRLFNEVMRSNNSKMWTEEEVGKMFPTPKSMEGFILIKTAKGVGRNLIIKNKDGKVIKPPSYSLPSLQPIIDEMSATQ